MEIRVAKPTTLEMNECKLVRSDCFAQKTNITQKHRTESDNYNTCIAEGTTRVELDDATNQLPPFETHPFGDAQLSNELLSSLLPLEHDILDGPAADKPLQ